ncbi:MAG: hypothetical protein ACU88J_16275 [Gammaproteobacteria bacterium]
MTRKFMLIRKLLDLKTQLFWIGSAIHHTANPAFLIRRPVSLVLGEAGDPGENGIHLNMGKRLNYPQNIESQTLDAKLAACFR